VEVPFGAGSLEHVFCCKPHLPEYQGEFVCESDNPTGAERNVGKVLLNFFLKKFDSSTTITPHFRCVPVVLAADSMQERSGSFDFVMGARDCDYDEVDGGYVVRIICEGDARVVVHLDEFPDLARVHVEADRRQVSWRHASASGSLT